MQSFEMPLRALETFKAAENTLRKELTPHGTVQVREVEIGKTKREIMEQMDRRIDRLRAMGVEVSNVQRTKIGRNAACPCGSGIKFKKCCIGKIKLIGS